MMTVTDLLALIDQYLAAHLAAHGSALQDKTLSYRLFGDSKKIGAMRAGSAGITVARMNAALHGLALRWPEGQPKPESLISLVKGDAA